MNKNKKIELIQDSAMHEKVSSAIYLFMPGVVLCCLVAVCAYFMEYIEYLIFQQAWLESLVLAIITGMLIRTFLPMDRRFLAGIGFCAKTLLEIAVVLLGASLSVEAVIEAGFTLFIGIAFIVFITIAISYAIGRLLGLSSRLAMLVACGNSICGNSAIVAAAPVIGADGKDVVAAIAFTAVLGVIVILLLPLAVPVFGLSYQQYGVFAGMTVYAVPQVLAATAPVSIVSVQTATLVKLIRVLMLGPVIFILTLIYGSVGKSKLKLSRMIPWFIVGFVILMLARSLHIIPNVALKPLNISASLLTIISMAALGLGVDIRSVAKAGGRVVVTAIFSLIILGLFSLIIIHLL